MNRAQTRSAVKKAGRVMSHEEVYRLLKQERKDSIDKAVQLFSVAMIDVLYYKANLDRDTIIDILENVQQTMDCINTNYVKFSELERNICEELNIEVKAKL